MARLTAGLWRPWRFEGPGAAISDGVSGSERDGLLGVRLDEIFNVGRPFRYRMHGPKGQSIVVCHAVVALVLAPFALSLRNIQERPVFPITIALFRHLPKGIVVAIGCFRQCAGHRRG
ncbi:hypothetical protein OF83DRAFT_117372 [Amylostereum chailletii]|nr:hypothetical protein OF83DRAFT_117372 [Amylostereum chailletii]